MRRQAPRQERIFAVFPPATNDVETRIESLDKKRDVPRLVLQIGIEGDNHRRARLVEAGSERRGLPEILAEANHAHAWVSMMERFQQSEARIGTAVVNEDDFVALAVRLENLGNLLMQIGEIPLFIEDGDDE